MVRLTDRPDMTIAVYRGCKTTTKVPDYEVPKRKFDSSIINLMQFWQTNGGNKSDIYLPLTFPCHETRTDDLTSLRQVN